MAKGDKGADGAKGKDKKGKGKGKGKGKAEGGTPRITLASHRPAMAAIRRARATGGLAAFILVGLLSEHAGVEDADALARALVAGIVGYLVTWAAAQAVWRQVVLAQVRQVEAAREQRRERVLEQLRERRDRQAGTG